MSAVVAICGIQNSDHASKAIMAMSPPRMSGANLSSGNMLMSMGIYSMNFVCVRMGLLHRKGKASVFQWEKKAGLFLPLMAEAGQLCWQYEVSQAREGGRSEQGKSCPH